jgi:hypothetical protein
MKGITANVLRNGWGRSARSILVDVGRLVRPVLDRLSTSAIHVFPTRFDQSEGSAHVRRAGVDSPVHTTQEAATHAVAAVCTRTIESRASQTPY